MKSILQLLILGFLLASCGTSSKFAQPGDATISSLPGNDTLIIQSLFTDRNSNISEENIQKILDGTYRLPAHLRVAIMRIDNQSQRFYWNDEATIKTKEAYQQLFEQKLKESPAVTKVSVIPELLISKYPTFTMIREAAVRMQADLVLVYAINSDVYSKYKVFSSTDIKAFATTQLLMMDVRTGLVPFSDIATKDYSGQKTKDELDIAEARRRIQNEAVLLTIEEIGKKMTGFLSQH